MSTNSGLHLKNCANFHEIWGGDQKKEVFIPKNARIFMNSGVKAQKQTVFIAKSTKKNFAHEFLVITSILEVSGLEFQSSSTESINFFGAQSLLGGTQFSFGGHKQ